MFIKPATHGHYLKNKTRKVWGIYPRHPTGSLTYLFCVSERTGGGTVVVPSSRSLCRICMWIQHGILCLGFVKEHPAVSEPCADTWFLQTNNLILWHLLQPVYIQTGITKSSSAFCFDASFAACGEGCPLLTRECSVPSPHIPVCSHRKRPQLN